jgi:hypothetical protein
MWKECQKNCEKIVEEYPRMKKVRWEAKKEVAGRY